MNPNERECPDCRDGFDRREFLRSVGGVAAAAAAVPLLGNKLLATPAPTPKSAAETAVKGLYDSLTDEQRKLADAKFLQDYRAARELILAGQYEAGINAMHALGRDANPDVANYIGYAYRRLGDFGDSKVWYEKALAVDPQHVRTWSYYGMWHAEQGNRLKAEDYLQKVKLICGTTDCEEYRQLRAVIDGTASY